MDTGALMHSANHTHLIPAVTSSEFLEFTHAPLDYGAPSIRLVRIQPTKSSNGSLQCELRHASTSSTYLCLSYVWGADDLYQWILVNGQWLRIRQNLYNFMRVARQQRKWRSRWFWIDAICIDQGNAMERNHQVKQMGDIFARAVQVVAWLGTKQQIVTFLQNSSTGKVEGKAVGKLQQSIEEAETTRGNAYVVGSSSGQESDCHDVQRAQNDADGFRYFCYADYWDRAWITQEVALARRITFMAGKASLAANSISFDHEAFCQLRVAALDPRTTRELRGRSLIYLLFRFKSKESGLRRDRVFSLLSLCGDGSDVFVDYEITDLQVAENVLNCCTRSFCLCSIGIVAFVLGVQTQLTTSQYVLGSRLDFAHITLPVTTEATHFERDLETPPVLHQPGPYGPILTLKVRALCRSYHGQIRISPDRTGEDFSVSYVDGYFDGKWNIDLIEGCRMVLSRDWQSCTASFSLQFLYEIVRLNRSLVPCCDRVTCEGTTSAWPASEPALTLSC